MRPAQLLVVTISFLSTTKPQVTLHRYRGPKCIIEVRLKLTLVTALFFCSAWSRLKLNTKIGLNHHHPPQTFRTVLGAVGD